MSKPCIRCGDCQVVCPVQLNPQFLHESIHAEQWERTQALNLNACLFCNACSAACPSEIKLNTQFRLADQHIKSMNEKKLKSLEAKQRFEAKASRIQRKKRLQEAQRIEKLAKATQEDKQAAIAAALARVQRKFQDA